MLSAVAMSHSALMNLRPWRGVQEHIAEYHHVCSRDQTTSLVCGSNAESRRGGSGHFRGDRDAYAASRDRAQPPFHSSHGRPDRMHGRAVSSLHGQGGRQGVQASRKEEHENREHANGHRVAQRGREDRGPDRYDGRRDERPSQPQERCRTLDSDLLHSSQLIRSACWQDDASFCV